MNFKIKKISSSKQMKINLIINFFKRKLVKIINKIILKKKYKATQKKIMRMIIIMKKIRRIKSKLTKIISEMMDFRMKN